MNAQQALGFVVASAIGAIIGLLTIEIVKGYLGKRVATSQVEAPAP